MKILSVLIVGFLVGVLQTPSLELALPAVLQAVRQDADKALELWPDYSPSVPFVVDIQSLADASKAGNAPPVDLGRAERALPASSRAMPLKEARQFFPRDGGGLQSRIKDGAIAIAIDSVVRKDSGFDFHVSYYHAHEGGRAPGIWETEVRRLRLHLEWVGREWAVTETVLTAQS